MSVLFAAKTLAKLRYAQHEKKRLQGDLGNVRGDRAHLRRREASRSRRRMPPPLPPQQQPYYQPPPQSYYYNYHPYPPSPQAVVASSKTKKTAVEASAEVNRRPPVSTSDVCSLPFEFPSDNRRRWFVIYDKFYCVFPAPERGAAQTVGSAVYGHDSVADTGNCDLDNFLHYRCRLQDSRHLPDVVTSALKASNNKIRHEDSVRALDRFFLDNHFTWAGFSIFTKTVEVDDDDDAAEAAAVAAAEAETDDDVGRGRLEEEKQIPMLALVYHRSAPISNERGILVDQNIFSQFKSCADTTTRALVHNKWSDAMNNGILSQTLRTNLLADRATAVAASAKNDSVTSKVSSLPTDKMMYSLVIAVLEPHYYTQQVHLNGGRRQRYTSITSAIPHPTALSYYPPRSVAEDEVFMSSESDNGGSYASSIGGKAASNYRRRTTEHDEQQPEEEEEDFYFDRRRGAPEKGRDPVHIPDAMYMRRYSHLHSPVRRHSSSTVPPPPSSAAASTTERKRTNHLDKL